MKNWSKYLFLFSVLVMFTSCETDNVGDSIVGTWRCNEESSTVPYRQYSVNIDRYSDIDTTLFVIYNFHNLGIEVETYIRLNDTIVSFVGTNNYYNVSGKGAVTKDLRYIEWEYSISGSNVNDNYVRALYFRK